MVRRLLKESQDGSWLPEHPVTSGSKLTALPSTLREQGRTQGAVITNGQWFNALCLHNEDSIWTQLDNSRALPGCWMFRSCPSHKTRHGWYSGWETLKQPAWVCHATFPSRAVASGSDFTLPASDLSNIGATTLLGHRTLERMEWMLSVCVCSQLRQHSIIFRGMARGVEIGYRYVTQTGVKFTNLLPQFPKSWDYRYMSIPNST